MFDRLLSRSLTFSAVLFVLAVMGGVLAVRQDPAFGHELLAGFRDQVALQVQSTTVISHTRSS